MLLRGGADINFSPEITDDTYAYFNPLELAVISGSINAVKVLIEYDVFITEVSIMHSIDTRNKEMIEVLLSGDLSQLSLSVVFLKLDSDMNSYPKDKALLDIFRLIGYTLGALLKISYVFGKLGDGEGGFECCGGDCDIRE